MANTPEDNPSITFDLAAGETYPLLVNSLSAYADVLRRQSQEQSGWGEQKYADALARTADEADDLVRQVIEARGGERKPATAD